MLCKIDQLISKTKTKLNTNEGRSLFKMALIFPFFKYQSPFILVHLVNLFAIQLLRSATSIRALVFSSFVDWFIYLCASATRSTDAVLWFIKYSTSLIYVEGIKHSLPWAMAKFLFFNAFTGESKFSAQYSAKHKVNASECSPPNHRWERKEKRDIWSNWCTSLRRDNLQQTEEHKNKKEKWTGKESFQNNNLVRRP